MSHETDSFHLDQYKMFSEVPRASVFQQRILGCLAVEVIHVIVFFFFSVLHNSKDLFHTIRAVREKKSITLWSDYSVCVRHCPEEFASIILLALKKPARKALASPLTDEDLGARGGQKISLRLFCLIQGRIDI